MRKDLQRHLSIIAAMTICSCNLLKPGGGAKIQEDSNGGNPAQESGLCSSAQTDLKTQLALVQSNASSSGQDESATIGSLIVGELAANMLTYGLSEPQAAKIAALAASQMNEAITAGTSLQIHPVERVSAPIVKGAFFALVDECVALSDIEERTKAAKAIVASVAESATDRAQQIESKTLMNTIESIASTGVAALGSAGITGESTPGAAKALTSGIVAALPASPLSLTDIASAAKHAASGIVSALDDAGIATQSLATMASSVTQSALHGLKEGGLTTEKLVEANAVGAIVGGASTGLALSGIDKSGSAAILGAITAGAVEIFDDLGMNSTELRSSALGAATLAAISAAEELSKKGLTDLGDATGAIGSEVVESLAEAGFPADEVAGATKAIVESGMEAIIAAGIEDAELIMQISTSILEGTLTGVAKILKSGHIDESKISAISTAASQTALNSISAMQTSGIIQSSQHLETLFNSINESISSGLEKGGANTATISTAQNSITSVMSGDAAQSIRDSITWAKISFTGSGSFGAVLNGGSSDRTISVTNGSSDTVNLSLVSLSDPFSILTQNCESLASSQTCQISIRFAPTSLSETQTTLSIKFKTHQKDIALSGKGAGPTSLTIDPPSPVLPTTAFVGNNFDFDLTVRNTGELAATSIGTLSLPTGFSQRSTTCADSVAAQSSCVYSIRLTPTAVQTYSGNASLGYHNGSATATATRSLSTEAANPASMSFDSPDQSIIQNTLVGKTASITITMTNGGGVSATNIGTASLPSGYSLTSTTCSSSLAVNASCSYTVSFSPTSVTSYSGSLSISFNNGASVTTATKALDGEGVNLEVAPTYSNAAQWNSYVRAGNNIVCAQADNRCDHGGEFRTVKLYNFDDCSNLSMTDAESWFDWACVDLGSTVEFRSKRLKHSVRLQDLIEVGTGSSHDWKPNSVTLKQSNTTIATSLSTRWWSNSIADLPDTTSTQAVLNTANAIYTVRDDINSKGVTINANGIGLVVFRGKTLTYIGGTDSSGAAVNASAVVSHGWIEGDYSAGSTGATAITIGNDPEPDFDDFWVVRHASFHGNTSMYVAHIFGDRHRFEHVMASRTGSPDHGDCMQIQGAAGIFYNIRATNCHGIGIYLGYQAEDTILVNVLTSNNSSGYEIGQHHANRNTVLNATVTSNGFNRNSTVEIVNSSHSATIVNQAIIGNYITGMSISSSGHKLANILLANNPNVRDFVTNVDNSTTKFYEKLRLNTGDKCYSAGTNSLVNIKNKAVANTGCEINTSVPDTGLSFSEHSDDFTGSFVGFVVSDATNSSHAGGIASAASIIGSQWNRFDHFYRAWKPKFNGTDLFPTEIYRPRCSGDCQIFDYRLRNTDTLLRNAHGAFVANAACPSSVHGDKYLDDANGIAVNRFLINAQEITDDALGDNDGLCESNEACIYSPNFGVYQGEGDYRTQKCTFTDSSSGGVTGVTMYAYPTNGV